MTFFEKLTKTLNRIVEVLPQFRDISALCRKRPSERLKSSLCKVYVNLLQFCQSVARVFAEKDGSKDFLVSCFDATPRNESGH